MNNTNIEELVISCILQNEELIKDLYIKEECFTNPLNKKMIMFFKKHYANYGNLDLAHMVNCMTNEDSQRKLIDYCTNMIDSLAKPSKFYEYQELMEEQYRSNFLRNIASKFEKKEIDTDTFVEEIIKAQNETMMFNNDNGKISPDDMLERIRKKDKLLNLNRLHYLDKSIKIKRRTVNIIGARPSEGKSALALNLFCDYAKTYKCLYFNMEMTENEVFERMLGIESNQLIKDIIKPPNKEIEQKVRKTAIDIYNMKYEIVNGSKSIKSVRNKIIREQRDEHLIVFIDYVGYITTDKKGQSDKDRIGEIVRELNGLTKDYNCTIFVIAQINRNGSDMPTMVDLKDSGELEQTADTIILIHDPNKDDTSDIKDVKLIIPKCRSGKRNFSFGIEYNKATQRFTI